MIPTREQIEADWANPRFTPETTALIWLCAMRDEIDRLRADLDRANTEAALARDALAKATTDHRAKVQNELRSVERALCSADVLTKYAALSRGTYECHVKNTIETAISALRDDASTPTHSPPFEGDPKDCAFTAYVRERNGLTSYQDGAVTPLSTIAKIDEMLAKPAPAEPCKECEGTKTVDRVDWPGEHANRYQEPCPQCTPKPAPAEQPTAVFSGARTIAESAEPPTPYMAPAPVPDDPRWGLVAQLADVVASIWGRSDCIEGEAKAIAAKLRGGA